MFNVVIVVMSSVFIVVMSNVSIVVMFNVLHEDKCLRQVLVCLNIKNVPDLRYLCTSH